jgi:hypothetical protein
MSAIFRIDFLEFGVTQGHVGRGRRLQMTIRIIARSFAIAALLFSAEGAIAQSSSQTPSQVLGQYNDGGKGMEDAVQSLMNADKTNLAAIIAFAKTANEDQRKAIGKALANVAKAYAAGGDPGSANSIQQAVVTAGIPELGKAYADAGGDTATASTGGGGGGGGGATQVGPPTGGANPGSTTVGNNFVVNSSRGLTDTGGGGGGGFTPTSTQ